MRLKFGRAKRPGTRQGLFSVCSEKHSITSFRSFRLCTRPFLSLSGILRSFALRLHGLQAFDRSQGSTGLQMRP